MIGQAGVKQEFNRYHCPDGHFQPLRKMSFNEEQKKLLNQKINRSNVTFRPGGGGQELAYVESWYVIQEANRIFGFDGWSSETIEAGLVAEDSKCVSYIAKVCITVGIVISVGYGSGHGVGMSQWGARFMASKGIKAERILKHFYKNAKIKPFNKNYL